MYEVIWSPRQDKYIIRLCSSFTLHNPEIVGTLEQCQAWLARIRESLK